MVNISVVPQGFENNIGKAKGHQILHGFFAQIVVDTIDLVFPEYRKKFIIDVL